MEEYNPSTQAERMKTFPFKEPCITDFFPNGINFGDTNWMTDDLVRLYEYQQELFWHNLATGIKTNDRIPSKVYMSKLQQEVNLFDEDHLEKLLFAGRQVQEDRAYNAMTDEEKEALIELRQSINKQFEDPNSVLNQALKYAVEQTETQREEIEELNKLMSDES
jgi:hypothetical protein